MGVSFRPVQNAVSTSTVTAATVSNINITATTANVTLQLSLLGVKCVLNITQTNSK